MWKWVERNKDVIFKVFLSSLSKYLSRVLGIRRLSLGTRDKDVFIETKNRAGEKSFLPLKTHDRRFHSAVGAAELNRRIETREPGFHSALSFGGYISTDQTAVLDPRHLFQSGLDRRFRTAARPPISTAVHQIW